MRRTLNIENIMKTKRFDFNFRPLQIDVALSVDGSVPDRQNYDADANTFTPDYSITPLVLFPAVSRMDRDEILDPGPINEYLTNIRWYEIVGGVSTLIAVDNPNYEIASSGTAAGRIKVKRNAQPQNPVTLEFYAEYVDSRTNQVHSIRASHLVKCDNATAYIPLMVLDAEDQTIYNPLVDTDMQDVHASLKLGSDECPEAKRQFVWEISRDGNTWNTVGDETTLDYPLSVSADGVTCIVNRALMGTELYLRCRARYDLDGNPGGVVLTDAAPTKIVSFIRRLPKYEFDIAGLPTNIPSGVLAVCPEVYTWDTNGPIEHPEKVLLPLWYIATNKPAGALSYAQVAHGFSPTIPTAAMSNEHGGVIGVDVIDPGPSCCCEDIDGAVFEDADGNLILID